MRANGEMKIKGKKTGRANNLVINDRKKKEMSERKKNKKVMH